MIFPFENIWWFYPLFSLAVVAFLIFEIKSPPKKAVTSVALNLFLAVVFDLGLYFYTSRAVDAIQAKKLALEFFGGYVMEQVLSIDNLFVFIVIFKFFNIEKQIQSRILNYGIFGAILFRGLFIGLGSYLIHFSLVMKVFGAFLIYTGFKILVIKENQDQDLNDGFAMRTLRKLLPLSSSKAPTFFVRENTKLLFTNLFLCLLLVEISDVVFALDSVPAIFGLTKEPLIVFTSNIFAIMSLRSMYFVLTKIMDRFHYLKYGLGVVLIFIGMKMAVLPFELSIEWSLAIILGILGVSMLFSVRRHAQG